MNDDKQTGSTAAVNEKPTGSTVLATELNTLKDKYAKLLALLVEVQSERDLARQTLNRMAMDINKVTDVAARLAELG